MKMIVGLNQIICKSHFLIRHLPLKNMGRKLCFCYSTSPFWFLHTVVVSYKNDMIGHGGGGDSCQNAQKDFIIKTF